MTTKELVEEVARLRAELAVAKVARPRISFKVSPKGAVSVYGLGRFPVTLYKEQWQRLLGEAVNLQAFITENESLLSVKA